MPGIFKIWLLLWIVMGVSRPFTAMAQTGDSLQVLTEPAFLDIVRKFHPIARQANLLLERARAELTAARSGFDPLFYTNLDQKTFDGKNYYHYVNTELKIPTWYGVEVKAGLENNRGDYTNPEQTLGKSSYLGVVVPLGKNLLMDERRAILKQAHIFRDRSKADQMLLINELLLEAYNAYWDWVREYQQYQIISSMVSVNQARFKLVKQGFRQGDRSAMDTTDALVQLQQFELAQIAALVQFRNAGLELSNFLWLENDSPYPLPANLVPDSVWKNLDINTVRLPILDQLINMGLMNHPKLLQYQFKLKSLDIERRLKFQSYLPTFNFKANLLNSGYQVFKDASWNLYENNYKFGIDLGIPLFLSKGRGEYKATKIKIQETNIDLSQSRLSIENKIRSYFNELNSLQAQVRLAEDNYRNYLRLYLGEITLFQTGESSLFLVNSRENKMLELMQKWIDLRIKFFKTYAGLQWAAGTLR